MGEKKNTKFEGAVLGIRDDSQDLPSLIIFLFPAK